VPIAPLAVAVEIRAQEARARLPRAFRLSERVAEEGLTVENDLPFEPGRPVVAELTLPDGGPALSVTGRVAGARHIEFTSLDTDTRRRLAAYVMERMLAP
jgi:hypothetical protein